MEPRDRATIINLTDAIKNLTKAIQPDSFHNRQVPALRRQTEALEYLRKLREGYINVAQGTSTVHKKMVLKIIDRVSSMLLSS